MSALIKLPDFFVVGAQKAGTTTLHDWLSASDELSLPTIKETHYFRDDDKYNQGIDWYLQWFDKNKKSHIRGEVDPEYMFFSEVAPRMQKLCANTKLIFVFRNIVERAYSHYQMSVRRGFETLSFADALAAESERLSEQDPAKKKHAMIHFSYMARGQYCVQINRFKTLFPQSPMLFLSFNELIGKEFREQSYVRICEFIGIHAVIDKVDFDKQSNPASQPRFTIVRDLIYGKSGVKKMLGKLIPSKNIKLKLAMMLDRINQQPVENKKQDWRASVPDKYWYEANNEIKQLEAITGLDCSAWYFQKLSEK